MEEIFNNLTALEKRIADYVAESGKVRMGNILESIPNQNNEFMQNTVRDLVHKEVLVMHQNPIVPDWTYELSYFYKHFKNLI